ncbi:MULTISPECIES: magnesium transporter MgtE N-terminal domain-containing protein [Methanobacterium]|uniref:Magnesium transporter MgtE n=1 Tax=Methanobacterium bryantii TaxID=2161 RepID=A0A2A2H156_METBR|nr:MULTISPECIES: CBS domain-containing protein [Methanobacterium]OEC86598.1 magnesium transporter MgtE [Methanobacterium sp. A39]PAV03119.1 magnesium transporter MgtE [Methanobacterium bryantii]
MRFLSEIMKKTVVDLDGNKIGKFKDFIVSVNILYPLVEAVSIRTSGKKDILVSWEDVDHINKEIKLKVKLEDIKEYNLKKRDIKLVEDVLDKQVVDLEGKKIRRINDLQLSTTRGYYRLIGVDISFKGILRRLGIEKIASSLKINLQEDYISWMDVDVLESDISRLKLKVPEYSLKKLHPADIAEIVDQLSINDSITIINSLDDEVAADALEEISPERQVSLFEEMETKRAADILEEMSPDDAADLIGELSDDRAQELLKLMDPEEAKDVESLLKYPEDTAGGIMTTEFASVKEGLTARETLNALREMAKEVESIYYIYILSNFNSLVGVMSLRELLLADPEQKIAEVMHRDIISVDVMEEEHDVAKKIAKYNLLALPVVKDENKIQGVVTVDDAIDIVLPTAWKKHVPRMFGR